MLFRHVIRTLEEVEAFFGVEVAPPLHNVPTAPSQSIATEEGSRSDHSHLSCRTEPRNTLRHIILAS